jgi:uncharacterized protein
MRYSPYIAPEPAAWLETDEDERLIGIQDFHARAREDSPSPRLHAVMHLIVENQLAMSDHDAVRDALTRLCNEGLDRHEALHALGSVLAEHMLDLAKGTPGTSDRTAEYHAKLAALSAARWRDSARNDPAAAEPDAGGGQDRTAEAGTHRQGETHRPLSETELDRLSASLSGLKNPDAMSLEALDGFLCALVAGPDLVMPSEYLPVIWGGALPDENAFSSLEEASALLQLIMRHWNSIIAELDETSVHLPLVEAPDDRGVPGRAWARGFMRGVRLSTSAGWTELFTDETEGSLLTIPIVAGEVDPAWPPEPVSADKAEDLLAGMAAALARAYRHFAAHRQAAAQTERRQATYRRSAAKVGRNDPCPCGSGKKFKHCCGSGRSSAGG